MSSDNCKVLPNYDQADDDADGVGNVCDNCHKNYTTALNQSDFDQDGVGDFCGTACSSRCFVSHGLRPPFSCFPHRCVPDNCVWTVNHNQVLLCVCLLPHNFTLQRSESIVRPNIHTIMCLFVCLLVCLFVCFIASRYSGSKVHTQTHTDTHRHIYAHIHTRTYTYTYTQTIPPT